MSATKLRPTPVDPSRPRRNTRAGQANSLSDLIGVHRRVASASARQLLRTPASTFVTVFVVAVALLLPAILTSLNSNLTELLAGFQDNAQISLYLRQDISETEGRQVSKDLLSMEGIDSGYYISSGQALDEFGEATGLKGLLLEMEVNPLPAAIIIAPSNVSPVAVEELALQLQARPEVEVAQVDSLWLQRLAAISRLVSAIGRVLSAIVILGLFFVVGNTIKLAVENRKAEIRVIKLVGGSDMFAARPFLYTGLLYGLCGGILATILQGIVLATFNSNLEQLMQLYESNFQLSGFEFVNALALMGGGALIGWAAALLASFRHIRSINP